MRAFRHFWSSSPPITSSDNKYEEERLNDHVYEIQAVESPHAEVVFFHGLPMDLSDASNAFWKTWTQWGTDKFWPKTMLPVYLNEGNQGPGFDIRVLAVTYDSRSNIPSDIGVAGTNDYLLSENLVKNLILNPKARVAGVGQGYDVPVILVGHDLGGILIKQLILYVENELHALDEGEEKEKLTKFLTNLTSVFFYSTPHNGSAAIEKLMNKIPADNRSPLLTFMTVLGKEMARVNARFTEYRRPMLNERPRFKTFAINAAFRTTLDGIFDKEEVCPEGTARLDIDQYYTVQANHYQVCQPKAMYSNSMTNLGTNIIEVVNEIRSRVAAEQELERLERLRAFGKELAESNNHTEPGRETGPLR